MRCMHSIEAGAYVLGALAPADRSGYQRHLAGCDVCREEVADLAGLPGLLSRLDEATAAAIAEGQAPGEVLRMAVATDPSEPPDLPEPGTDDTVPISGLPISGVPISGVPISGVPIGPRRHGRRFGGRPAARPLPAPPPSLLPDVLETTRARRAQARRRNRWLTTGAAVLAACLVLVSFVSGLAMRRQQAQQPVARPAVWMAPMEAAWSGVPVTAVIGLIQTASGTHIAMSCTYANTGDKNEVWHLKMVVFPKSGGPGQTLSNFDARPSEYKAVNVDTALWPGQIDRIEVELTKGTTLLTYWLT
jgi:hypothetical protein